MKGKLEYIETHVKERKVNCFVIVLYQDSGSVRRGKEGLTHDKLCASKWNPNIPRSTLTCHVTTLQESRV